MLDGHEREREVEVFSRLKTLSPSPWLTASPLSRSDAYRAQLGRVGGFGGVGFLKLNSVPHSEHDSELRNSQETRAGADILAKTDQGTGVK